MTREQKIEAFTLRLDGFTFEQIAEHMGCTSQYIQGMLHCDNCGGLLNQDKKNDDKNQEEQEHEKN